MDCCLSHFPLPPLPLCVRVCVCVCVRLQCPEHHVTLVQALCLALVGAAACCLLLLLLPDVCVCACVGPHILPLSSTPTHRWDADSASPIHSLGAGLNMMQLAWPGEALAVGKEGALEVVEEPAAKVLVGRGVE